MQHAKAKTPAKDKKRTRSLPPPITTKFHNKKNHYPQKQEAQVITLQTLLQEKLNNL